VVAGVRDAVNRVIGLVNQLTAAWSSLRLEIPPISSGCPPGDRSRLRVSGGPWRFGLAASAPIPLLAEGGTVLRAGAALVGEAGPELVRLPRGATVQPLGTRATNVTIHLDRPIFWGMADFEDEVVRALDRAARRGRRAGPGAV